jgi:hypothetical protein
VNLAEEIDQEIVILGEILRIGHDSLEHDGDPGRHDFESCFFEHFADQCILDAFSCFDRASRKGPFSFQRLFASFDQENTLAIEDQRPDA